MNKSDVKSMNTQLYIMCVCFRWRPKRASDKLCQREDDKHTPAAKKQWGEDETHTRVPNRT